MVIYATIDLPANVIEEVEKVCSDINARDSTFKYKFYKRNEEELRLMIECKDKDEAWRRITWLTHKVDIIRKTYLRYAVVQK